MDKKTKIIILIAFYIISLIDVFLLSKNITINKYKDSKIKIEEDLNKANSKISDIEQRNDELLKFNDKQQKINNELKAENDAMKKDLEKIKSTAQSTKEKLDEVENSTDKTISIIQKLRNNNSILREYFQSTCEIIGE